MTVVLRLRPEAEEQISSVFSGGHTASLRNPPNQLIGTRRVPACCDCPIQHPCDPSSANPVFVLVLRQRWRVGRNLPAPSSRRLVDIINKPLTDKVNDSLIVNPRQVSRPPARRILSGHEVLRGANLRSSLAGRLVVRPLVRRWSVCPNSHSG